MVLHSFTRPIFWAPWLAIAILSYFFVDLPLTYSLFRLDKHHHSIALVFTQINHLGTAGPYLIAAGFMLLWAFFLEKNYRLTAIAAYILATIIVSGIACDILKILLGRARPYEFFSHHIYGFYFWKFDNNFWSMPSGHVTTIAAVASAGYLLLRRFGWFFWLAVSLVFLGRIICRAHYLSDVMAGAYLGFIVAYWLYPWFENRIKRYPWSPEEL